MSTLLVYVSVQSGRIKRGSLEVLTRCREIASAGGHALHAMVAHPEAEALAGEIARYGPRPHLHSLKCLSGRTPEC